MIYKKKYKMILLSSIQCDSIELEPQEQRVFNMIFPVIVDDDLKKKSGSSQLFSSSASDRIRWWITSAVKLGIIYLFINPLFSKVLRQLMILKLNDTFYYAVKGILLLLILMIIDHFSRSDCFSWSSYNIFYKVFQEHPILLSICFSHACFLMFQFLLLDC